MDKMYNGIQSVRSTGTGKGQTNMYTNTVWIIGADGRVGRSLMEVLKKEHHWKIIATDKDVDVTDITALRAAAQIYRPTLIINCAGITDADYCETHRSEAYKVNALGARNVATVSRQLDAKIIHFSTDDVFCGINERAKNEFDVPTPNTVYGLSKLAGENMVRELNPKHLIIRTSWLYGIGTGDYFHYVCEKGARGEKFTASLNMISTPTSAAELLKAISAIVDHNEYGIFHAACEGMCSRMQYAATVLEMMGYDPSLVEGVMAATENNKQSIVLENLMLDITGIYKMPDWKDAMAAHVKTIKGE